MVPKKTGCGPVLPEHATPALPPSEGGKRGAGREAARDHPEQLLEKCEGVRSRPVDAKGLLPGQRPIVMEPRLLDGSQEIGGWIAGEHQLCPADRVRQPQPGGV